MDKRSHDKRGVGAAALRALLGRGGTYALAPRSASQSS
jgi:hypothetical protein